MPNPMDSIPFNTASHSQNLEAVIQQIKQNPQAFEDHIRKTNPQAYQQALQIRNSQNPQTIIMQMIQSRGINPNVLSMLGIK